MKYLSHKFIGYLYENVNKSNNFRLKVKFFGSIVLSLELLLNSLKKVGNDTVMSYFSLVYVGIHPMANGAWVLTPTIWHYQRPTV